MTSEAFEPGIVEEQDNFPNNDKCPTCGGDERLTARLTAKLLPCAMDVFMGITDVYKNRWNAEDGYVGEIFIQNWKSGYRIIGPFACEHDDEIEPEPVDEE